MDNQLDRVINEAKQKGNEMLKTIIFVVNLLLLKLGKYAFVPAGSTNGENTIIGIFHSMSWPKKEKRLTEFRSQSKKKNSG